MRFSRAFTILLIIGLFRSTATSVVAQSAASIEAAQRYQQLYSQRQYKAALPFAQRAVALAQADQSLNTEDRIGVLNNLAELYYLLGDYAKAEHLARQVLALRKGVPPAEYDLHAIAISQEDIAELLDLQGKLAEGAVLHRSAEKFLNNPTLGATATSALGRQDVIINQSVLDVYDKRAPEDRGYGRYAYILFPSKSGGNCERCLQLLTAFLEDTPTGPVSRPIRAQVNIFEVPITGHRDEIRKALETSSRPTPNSLASPSSSTTNSAATSPSSSSPSSSTAMTILQRYDYASANELLTKACAGYRRASGKFCGTLAQGPYLVTYPRPVSAGKSLPAPYLIVDMSNVHPRAFHFFLERVKQQVGVSDMRDENRINSTFVRAVSIVLDAADVLDPTAKAVALWVKLVKR